MLKRTGGQLIYNKLLQHKVKDAFIFSGGSVMSIIDPFYKGEINYYINNHEQNCGHAATGYAKLSGKPGVCLVTSGPGITNMITPMLDATNDSTSLIVISGQVPKHAVGTNAFQEAPAVDLSKHVTKWSHQIRSIDEIGNVLDHAFYIAQNGKKGSVHIDVPKCVSSDVTDKDFGNVINTNVLLTHRTSNKYNNHYRNIKPYGNYITENKIIDIYNVLLKSKKPIIYLGQGCVESQALLRDFAIKNNIPVTSTIHGKGIFDDHHPLSLEWCGMHGLAAANYALQEADCIIALGSRFDDRTTGSIKDYAPVARKNKAIIHVNIEKSEINKALKTNYNIHSSCEDFLLAIGDIIKYEGIIPKKQKWIRRINTLKEKYPFDLKISSKENDTNHFNLYEVYKKDTVKGLHMEEVIHELYQQTLNKDVVFTTGVGNHQMQTYQFIKAQYPRKILSSGSLGVMGSGLPYAIGAQISNKNKLVIDIDGDSSFNMTMGDLKTIVENNLPIKIAIMNNNSQMMVTIWEKLYFEGRYTATLNERNPDYIELAKSFGIKAIQCCHPNMLNHTIDEFINYDGPILCEFKIKKDICLPLVGPGKALDDMILPGEVTLETIHIDGNEVPS